MVLDWYLGQSPPRFVERPGKFASILWSGAFTFPLQGTKVRVLTVCLGDALHFVYRVIVFMMVHLVSMGSQSLTITRLPSDKPRLVRKSIDVKDTVPKP